MTIGIGLLGLGTVGAGVAEILSTPEGRHPLVGQLKLERVAVRDPARSRPIALAAELVTTDPEAVVNDPAVDIVVEVIGGLEPARSLILAAIAAGKSVVTANKAVIARHGEEIAAAAAARGVYVLIEAAVGGGIPIIEPLKQSLGGNRLGRVSGIINGTTNYILSRMAAEGAAYAAVLADAQALGYAEADPAADVEGGDAAVAWSEPPSPPRGSATCSPGMSTTPPSWASASSCWPWPRTSAPIRTAPSSWMCGSTPP
jgi:homoserine dehydrogenase